MAVIDHIDGPNRDIYLSVDTFNGEIHPIDIYKEMRALRRADETLRNFDVFLSAKGNDPKGGGKFTERYVICNLGTRIVPYDQTGSLTITGTVITDDGQEGISCFDKTLLTPGVLVDLNYVPPQVEVVRAEAELAAILQISFNDVVCIDQTNGYSGTGLAPNGFQIGTRRAPSNNIFDADLIVHETGLNVYNFLNSYTFSDESFGVEPHVVKGDNVLGVNLNIDELSNVDDVEFRDLQITGYLDTNNVVRDCIVYDLHNVNNFIYNSVLSGTLYINANTSIQSCWISPSAPARTVTLDFEGNVVSVLISDWAAGHIHLKGLVPGSFVGFVGEGILSIDADCTGGAVTYGGAILFDGTNSELPDMLVDFTISKQSFDKVTTDLTAIGTQVTDLWQLQGLDIGNPLTVTPTSRIAGIISQAITGDGSTTTTVTRT